MELERIPMISKKIDYSVIARLLGLDQLNPCSKLSLANVRLDSGNSLDTGSVPQLEGLLDLFSKHKIAEPETLLSSQPQPSAQGQSSVDGTTHLQFQPSILGDFLKSCANYNNSSTLQAPKTTISNNSNSSLSNVSGGAVLQSAVVVSPNNGVSGNLVPLLNIPNTVGDIFRNSVNQLQHWYGSFTRNISHKITQNSKMILLQRRRTRDRPSSKNKKNTNNKKIIK